VKSQSDTYIINKYVYHIQHATFKHWPTTIHHSVSSYDNQTCVWKVGQNRQKPVHFQKSVAIYDDVERHSTLQNVGFFIFSKTGVLNADLV